QWIDDFVPIDSEEGGKKAESSKREATSSKKRQRADLDDENCKRQKLEDAAEKEGLKTYLKIDPDEDRAVNYAITRADGSTKFYKIFTEMLEDFDKQDLVDLQRLVKERSASRALEGWKLYETYGVHTLLMDGTLICINMLVEKKYPLTQEMLTSMLNWRLEANFESEMAYELIRGELLGIRGFYNVMLLVQVCAAGED
ncbi:hypothetical protein Tco_1071913, partial [Tanacetum coccineum]